MKLLVLGESGQLARHLRALLPEAQYWGRSTFDMNNTAGLEEALVRASPDVVVNAAAYTRVDQAESSPADAWRLNAEAPAAAARAAESLGFPLIHLSTDYVFDGESETEYSETSRPRPLNVYGRTKLGGELAVETLCQRHLILRTSWVFSEYEPNFVLTMLRLCKQRDWLSVVNDQHGRPTYAGHIASLIERLLGTIEAGSPPPWGLYHAVGGDAVSWYDFAREIFTQADQLKLIDSIPILTAISTNEYSTPAPRPLNAVLAPSRALSDLSTGLFDWRDGLRRTLAAICAAKN